MSFTNRNGKEFTTEDKVKMFEQMGSIGALIAVVLVLLIESGYAGEYAQIADFGLTAMIVVLAVSLAGSIFYKRKLK